MTPLLDVRDLDFAYGDVEVLRGVSLNVNPARSSRWWGATAPERPPPAQHLASSPPRAGTLVFDGKDLTHLASHQVSSWACAGAEGRRSFPR